MSITITYHTLFDVKVLHHFFLNKAEAVFEKMTPEEKAAVMLKYDCHDFLDIRPTEATRQLLQSHSCIFRHTATGFLAGIKVDAGSAPTKVKPFIPFEQTDCLTFTLEVTDMNFLNYTALPFTSGDGSIYYFDNRTDFRKRVHPSLSTVPPLIISGNEYMPGDMLANHATNPTRLWIARLKTSASTASADWQSEKKADGFPMEYVNDNDRLKVVRGILSYHVKTAGAQPLTVIRNEAGNILTPTLSEQPGDHRIIQADLQAYPEGIYTARFETPDASYSDEVTFFLLHQREIPFAIVRLFVQSDLPAFSLVDPSGDLTEPAFDLRFRNRSTHWRYIGPKFNGNSVTAQPLPLTRLGTVLHVSAPDKDGNPVDDLPNPVRPMINTAALSSAGEKKFYSDIHIH